MLFRPLFAALLGVTLFAAPLFASELESVPPIANAAAKKECGACHMAFQPQFLSAATWTTIFKDLSNHFGDNASLPDATRKDIEAYYVANAGRSQSGLLRISQQSWYLRQHREVGQAKFAAVKSKANCNACHKTADKGQYEN